MKPLVICYYSRIATIYFGFIAFFLQDMIIDRFRQLQVLASREVYAHAEAARLHTIRDCLSNDIFTEARNNIITQS